MSKDLAAEAGAQFGEVQPGFPVVVDGAARRLEELADAAFAALPPRAR